MSLSCDHLCVVLVEPKGAGNIGSVARVMKNFGFGELRLVQPRASHLGAEARNMAVSAVDLLERARVYRKSGSRPVRPEPCLGHNPAIR